MAQPLLGVVDGGPRGRVGEGMGVVVVRRAGLEQRRLVGEVSVDGHPVNAGALGDVGDLGGRRAAFDVQRGGGFEDATPGVGLPLGALFVRRVIRSTYSVTRISTGLSAAFRIYATYCCSIETGRSEPEPTNLVDVQRVQANDAVLHTETRGDGPAVLLIAGAGGDAAEFAGVAAALADEFTVTTYDRRGNSRSPRPTGWASTSVAEQADDAAGLLTALGHRPAVVVGTSAGGSIALEVALRHPDTVRAAIIHEPPIIAVTANPQAVTAASAH